MNYPLVWVLNQLPTDEDSNEFSESNSISSTIMSFRNGVGSRLQCTDSVDENVKDIKDDNKKLKSTPVADSTTFLLRIVSPEHEFLIEFSNFESKVSYI